MRIQISLEDAVFGAQKEIEVMHTGEFDEEDDYLSEVRRFGSD